MLLDSTSWGFNILFTAAPPHLSIKFRLMRLTAPIEIDSLSIFHSTNGTNSDSKFNFSSILCNFVDPILKLLFLYNHFILCKIQTFDIILLFLNKSFLLKYKVISLILKHPAPNDHKHLFTVVFLSLFN